MLKLFFKKVSSVVGGIDLVITPASVVPSAAAFLVTLKASVSINAGDLCYKTADGKWGLADSNAATPICLLSGMAVCSGAVGQPVTVATKDAALVPGATLVPGTTYVLSANPGKMCPDADAATGWKKQIAGAATSASVFDLSPDNTNAVV